MVSHLIRVGLYTDQEYLRCYQLGYGFIPLAIEPGGRQAEVTKALYSFLTKTRARWGVLSRRRATTTADEWTRLLLFRNALLLQTHPKAAPP